MTKGVEEVAAEAAVLGPRNEASPGLPSARRQPEATGPCEAERLWPLPYPCLDSQPMSI